LNINDLTYGIELEFETNVSANSFSNFLNTMPPNSPMIHGERYNHLVRDYWKLTTDGSLINGFELVSPILKGDDGLEAIRRVTEALGHTDAYINSRCGFHVHVGVPSGFKKDIMFFKRLAFLYVQFENEVWDQMMPLSRRGNNNSYCLSLQFSPNAFAAATTLRGLSSTLTGSNRYVKLNFESFFLHGTVEFRHHSGTLEFTKIKNWIDICRQLVVSATRLNELDVDFISTYEEVVNKIVTIHKNILPWSLRTERVFQAVKDFFCDHLNNDTEFCNADFLKIFGQYAVLPLHVLLQKAGLPYTKRIYKGRTHYRFKCNRRNDIPKDKKYDLEYLKVLTSMPEENIMYIKERIKAA